MGGGSNLLVGDDPLEATVVLVRTRGVELVSQDACGGGELRVAAGEDWDAVVAAAVERAWRAGIVVVAAAGNDGPTAHQLAMPAADPFVLAVGASSSPVSRSRSARCGTCQRRSTAPIVDAGRPSSAASWTGPA